MRSTIALWIVVFQIVVLTSAEMGVAGTWRDDFEDRNEREWKIYNLDRQVEKWWVNKGEVVGQIFKSGFMSLWLTGDLKWNNYSLLCRAKLVKEKRDPATLGLTLYDRGDEDSRYLFFINFTLGVARIIKATPNVWFTRNFPFVGDIDTWYELRASVKEDVLEFQIDNQVFSSRDVEPLKSGQAGLVISNAEGRFDDIEIRGENVRNGGPGRPRAVDLKGKLATTWGRIKSE